MDDVEEIIEFLTWLEEYCPVRLEFRDKPTIAEAFVEVRHDRIWREYQSIRKNVKRQ